LKKLTLPIATLVALLSGAASAAQVWITHASVKVRPQTQPPADASTVAQLQGAQNEFEAFHVVVSGAASGVSMSVESLSDGNGHTIQGRDLTLYRESMINVTQPTGGDGASGQWPDALVPDRDPIVGEKRNAFPFDVPNGESRAVYVDIHIPAKAPAGEYKGVLNVTGGVTAQVPVSVTVWDFALPSTSTLRSAFGMTWNGPCVGHGDGSCSNTAAEQALRARYVQAALDNRVSLYAPYFQPPVDPNGNGDWSAFDAWAGPFLDGTADTRLAGAKLTGVEVYGSSNTATVKAWADHFAAKGWSNSLFNYICDEPPMTCQWGDVNTRIAQSRAASPGVQTLVTTTSNDAKKNGVTGVIDLYVPVVNQMEDHPGTALAGNQRGNYGPVVWWYQSCMSFGCSGVGPGYDYTGGSGWPTYAIDSDGTRNRAMEWMSFSYDMSGELYYETTMAYFSGDPWTKQFNFGGTGDGTLFYPGTTAKIGGNTEIPIESLRMKGIRDGMEDYELLAMAKKAGFESEAKAIAKRVFAVTYEATTTPAKLDQARHDLAALILKGLGKDQPPPAVATPDQSGTILPTGAPNKGFPEAGCSSSGPQSAWLAIPLVALFVFRRRRAE
jgi:MYXO-CTERM domain-containing protein